jgi:outer membrane protein TolC
MWKAWLITLLLFAGSPALAAPQAPDPTSTAAQSNPIAVPPPPAVSDPMLAPVPAPPRVIGSWEEALGLLKARSTDLRIALDQVLAAEAQTRQALAAYLPQITGTGKYLHNILTKTNQAPPNPNLPPGIPPQTTRVPTPDLYSADLQLQQSIVNVQNFDQISIDELSEDAAKLSVDDEKRTLLLSVSNQLVAVVTAERQAEINRVGLRTALEQLAITTRKQALGAANGLDVVRAQQNAANARATLVTGDETLREAREALGLALGIPEETGVAHDIHIDGLAQSAMASCRTVSSVSDRADVAAARANLEVAKRNLRNVYYQFLPTLGAQTNLDETSNPNTGYPNPTWSILGVLSIPIWDGGNRYGLIRGARASEDIATQKLEALRRQAIIQVQQTQRQLVVAEQSDEVAREQRDLALRNDQMTQTAYSVGQGTSLELVTASEQHRQQELNLALQDFGVVKARILAVLALATCPW